MKEKIIRFLKHMKGFHSFFGSFLFLSAISVRFHSVEEYSKLALGTVC